MTLGSAPTSVGILLRQWRERRRMSQLALSIDAEISSRHLSFVETGRSRPSKEMVLLLAEVLALRTIVLNLQFAVASGEPMTSDAMKRLIDRADDEKHRRAFERLTAPPWRP